MKSITEIDDRTLRSFRWPTYQDSPGKYLDCRYLADFVLKHKNGEFVEDMFVSRVKESSCYVAVGTLLARPGSNEVSLQNIEIPFIAYSIDFSEKNSPQRGYWMESSIKGRRVFYKLVRPHSTYMSRSEQMQAKILKFLEVYDYLTSLKHLFNRKGFIECNLTIQDMHVSSKGGFDLDFVKENGTLVLLNLVNSLQELKCVLFIDSIREISHLERKDVISCFPSISQKSFLKALAEAKAKSQKELQKDSSALTTGDTEGQFAFADILDKDCSLLTVMDDMYNV
jgi:hypothetical protein